jgi:hypothetical protein
MSCRMSRKKGMPQQDPEYMVSHDVVPPWSPWENPFDLGGLPAKIVDECGKVAPFLLGRTGATYDSEFFHNVLGLNNSGLSEKDLTDITIPREWLQSWPASAEGRYNFNDCKDPKLKNGAREMYIQVYGAPPNNGGVSSTFLQGVYMFQEEADVNWAEWVAKIHGGRMKNAGRNPNKLTPPALRKQIQGILTVLGGYISGSMDPNSLKLGDLLLSMPPTARTDTLSTFLSTQHPL